MFSEAQRQSRSLFWLAIAYLAAVILLVAVSARLWWQSPLELVAYEFDYFLGLFSALGDDQSRLWLERGRLIHLGGFLIVGLLYLALVSKLMQSPHLWANRRIAWYAALLSLAFAAGMPWVSPDVFFYIGKGWQESHYGISPYLAPISHLPGYQSDQMFANIFPGFLHTATGYGPLFQKVSEVIAALSGGNEKLALAFHKIVNLGLHAACSVLVYRLAPAPFARVAAAAYALNPLVCFSVLTCVHNDHWMNMFMLLALLALSRKHWAWTGVALGAAFGVKYFPLVYVPIIGLAALVQPTQGHRLVRRLADATRFAFGFLATIAASFLVFYPEALPHFAGTLGSGGAPVYRNSVYLFVDTLSALVLPGVFGTTPLLLLHEFKLQMGGSLRLIYMVVYAASLLLLLPRLRRDTYGGSVEACLVVTVLYFIIANTSNQEWYLTWFLGFALVLPYARAYTLALRISALFLPLVIYTVKGGSLAAELLSNSLLYLLIVVLCCQYLRRLKQQSDEGGGLFPAVHAARPAPDA